MSACRLTGMREFVSYNSPLNARSENGSPGFENPGSCAGNQMGSGATTASKKQSRVVVLTADADFAQGARSAFGAPAAQTDLEVLIGRLAAHADALGDDASAIVLDIDPSDRQELAVLTRLMRKLTVPV